MFSRRALGLAGFAFLVAAVLTLCASAPPPVMRAALSANGEWLVTVDFELAPPQDSGGGRRVLSTTFRVAHRDPFLNGSRDLLTAPGTLWSERWSLTLSGADSPGAARWPIISDDGRTLLLVRVTTASPDLPVFSIFRHEQLRGKFIRSYTLNNLWPAEKIPRDLMDKGYTPMWFVGSRFHFSADGTILFYVDQWSGTRRIRLSDGVMLP